jgi:hypothetical protein
MGPTPGMLIKRRQTWSWRAVSRTRLSMMATWSRRAAPATSSFQDDRQCGVAGDRVPHLTIPLCAAWWPEEADTRSTESGIAKTVRRKAPAAKPALHARHTRQRPVRRD